MPQNPPVKTTPQKPNGGTHPVTKKAAHGHAKTGTHPTPAINQDKKQVNSLELKPQEALEKVTGKTAGLHVQTGPKLTEKEVKDIEDWIKESKWEVSKPLLEFIGEAEDLRLKIYDANTQANAKFDAKGNIIGSGDWTIGIGHQLKPGEIASHKFNAGITKDQAYELLKKDIHTTVVAVNKMLNYDSKITQFQYDALVSFAYQQGVNNQTISNVVKLVNTGDYKKAAATIKTTGHKTTRRESESKMMSEALYLTGILWQS